MEYELVDFDVLEGLTLSFVDSRDHEKLIFKTTCGRTFEMFHDQDCCEDVFIESIVGSLQDLVGSPICLADETINDMDSPLREYDECYAWTFYKLATIFGYVDIRWYGSSNGYYSVTASLYEVK